MTVLLRPPPPVPEGATRAEYDTDPATRHYKGSGPGKDDRDPGRRQQQDPGDQARCRLEQPGSKLVHRLVEGRRAPDAWGECHGCPTSLPEYRRGPLACI